MSDSFAATIDVREIPPYERHSKIFSCFNALRPGEALQLVNDHDPRPLHSQFQVVSGGSFSWDYLEAGPRVWRVRIGKVQTGGSSEAAGKPVSNGNCCSGGSCG